MYSLFKVLEDGSKELLEQSENKELLESSKQEGIDYSLEVSTEHYTTVLY